MNDEGQADASLPSGSLPFPPLHLLQRTGFVGDDDPVGAYARMGRSARRAIESALPPDWEWKGRRVLDFGCGAGRVLRHFAPEADEAEFWGCEIDRPSIEWLHREMCPPFQAERILHCEESPGLPVPDGHFDLIYAMSVYTHISDQWAAWLLEHHRILAEDGLLFATFLGEGTIESEIGEQWDDSNIGMNAVRIGQPWDLGGPSTFISPWWLQAHWGRAFDVLMIAPRGEARGSHGVVLLRRKPVRLSVEDLERLEPDEPREISALQHNVEQLRKECVELRALGDTADGVEVARLRAEVRWLERRLHLIEGSQSWKLTAPVREAAAWMRRRMDSTGSSSLSRN